MSLFSKLFGGGAAKPESKPETYEGFTITPTPIADGSHYRVSAMIEKDGKSHTLIRADTLDDLQGANAASIRKAKQMIDEQGEQLFN